MPSATEYPCTVIGFLDDMCQLGLRSLPGRIRIDYGHSKHPAKIHLMVGLKMLIRYRKNKILIESRP